MRQLKIKSHMKAVCVKMEILNHTCISNAAFKDSVITSTGLAGV